MEGLLAAQRRICFSDTMIMFRLGNPVPAQLRLPWVGKLSVQVGIGYCYMLLSEYLLSFLCADFTAQ